MKKHSLSFRILTLTVSAFLAAGCLTACGKSEAPAVSESATQELTQAVESTAAEETSAEAETSAPAEETEAETEAPVETTQEAQTEATEPEKKAPETKEEIIALYNESANAVKTGAKSVVSNYTLNTQTGDAALSNKMLESIANKLISANMGYDKKKDHVTYSGLASIRDNFPSRGKDWSSKLTSADVTRATITEKDGIYTVTLYLAPDTTPNIKAGEGHAGKAFSIITKEQIVDGAGSLGMSVIEEDSIKLTFKDGRIVAKIDAETGKLQDVNYYIDWTLALTALGIDVSVSFGAEDDYSVNW